MSALQFLREKAGVLVAGLIGFSLFLFVVSDFFGGGRGQRMKQKKYYEIGQIGGEYISYQDYELRLQNLLEIYKLSGISNVDEATNETLREQTWQQMVREKILDPQYKKLGIGVSTEEVDELVLGNNPHQIVQQLFTDQKTGVFNKSFLVNFLKQTEVDETAKKYWLFFEDEIKQAEQWINKAKEEFTTAPDPVQFINLSADSRYIGFFIPLSSVPENIKEFVKKEDLKAVFGPYIENGSYKVAKLIAVADRPDSVHVRHILLSTGKTRTLETAQHQADSLIKLINCLLYTSDAADE